MGAKTYRLMPKMNQTTWDNYRSEAKNWQRKRDESFRKSVTAYKRRDYVTAKYYSNMRKDFQNLCDDANRTAAEAIFTWNNENRPVNEIDLHGLYVNEALNKLADRVNYASERGINELAVIVGQGIHSEGEPTLKPNVILFAQQNYVPYKINLNNPGCIYFDLTNSNENDSGLSWT
ncbi:Smr domain-containing protein, partial [Pseudolycoriella hygida]